MRVADHSKRIESLRQMYLGRQKLQSAAEIAQELPHPRSTLQSWMADRRVASLQIGGRYFSTTKIVAESLWANSDAEVPARVKLERKTQREAKAVKAATIRQRVVDAGFGFGQNVTYEELRCLCYQGRSDSGSKLAKISGSALRKLSTGKSGSESKRPRMSRFCGRN